MRYLLSITILIASFTSAAAMTSLDTRACKYLGNDLKKHSGEQRWIPGRGWGPCSSIVQPVERPKASPNS